MDGSLPLCRETEAYILISQSFAIAKESRESMNELRYCLRQFPASTSDAEGCSVLGEFHAEAALGLW